MLDKESFFTELFDLDKPDDSDEDVRGLLNTIQACRPSKRLACPSHVSSRRVIHTSRLIQPLGRTVSPSAAVDDLPEASLFGPLHQDKTAGSGIVATPLSHEGTVELSRVQSSAYTERRKDEKTKMSSTPGKKRKRGQSLEVLSEAQQIFRGLRFCLQPVSNLTTHAFLLTSR